MLPAEELRQRLSELRRLYDAVQALRGRLDDLRTVEQAQAAYEAVLTVELARVTELQRRLEELRLRWGRLTARVEGAEAEPLPWSTGTGQLWSRRAAPPRQVPTESDSPARAEARERLALLVNRFQFVWRLGAEVLGRVNEIVADEGRPLGEALALLPWEAFADGRREATAQQLTRLTEWEQALAEYRGRIESDVNIRETRFRSWLGVWELWRSRECDPHSGSRWDTFLAERRRALIEEADRLRQEIEDLEKRLGGQS
ncbi:MAG TPA: hypothetical protein VEL76_28695 [Gemmataceae bacterium]|nr:hypothetical protein [Gemmataceae bacterium]